MFMEKSLKYLNNSNEMNTIVKIQQRERRKEKEKGKKPNRKALKKFA